MRSRDSARTRSRCAFSRWSPFSLMPVRVGSSPYSDRGIYPVLVREPLYPAGNNQSVGFATR
jgi:hypothetical protein